MRHSSISRLFSQVAVLLGVVGLTACAGERASAKTETTPLSAVAVEPAQAVQTPLREQERPSVVAPPSEPAAEGEPPVDAEPTQETASRGHGDMSIDQRIAAQRGAAGLRVNANQLQLPGPVVFELGKAQLAPAGEAVALLVAEYLHANPGVTLRVEVHTDSQGSDVHNQALSEARALEVARWLVQDGVPCQRVIPTGFGETRPVASNATEEGRSRNRRVTFMVAAHNGLPVSGMPLDGGGRIAGDPCRP